jgi:cytoskeletal protein CcmA (bactofilin family)
MNIGATIVVKGSVTAGEDLSVAGRIEGEIRLSGGSLMLVPGSLVIGDVTVSELVVYGTVEGNVTAADRVDLRRGGSVAGDVLAPRLAVADGALLNGRVDVRAAAGPRLVTSAVPVGSLRVAV